MPRHRPTDAAPTDARPAARLPPNVRALGAVSFLTDAASEMIYPLLPLFVASTLGAGAAAVGVIEGAAETTAALLKLVSGWWSDRLPRRKPLVIAGYTLASLVRPLVALAQGAGLVLAVRVTDRVGKGLRTAPRDALLADSVEPAARGRAFGFHRAADHAGAVVGPLLAFALLAGAGLELRTVFWLALVPGVLSVIVLVAFVREAPRSERPPHASLERHGLGSTFWRYVAILLLFTLGNSTDAFLLLRAADLGVGAAAIPLLWGLLHVVKSASSTHGGALSDRLGRRTPIVAGWVCYAAVYIGLAAASTAWHAWALFAAYGLFFGLTEGPEKALVADLVPERRRGTAFGWYNLSLGLGALPASVLFGLVWDRFGAATAFAMGACLSGAAAVLLVAFVHPPRPAA